MGDVAMFSTLRAGTHRDRIRLALDTPAGGTAPARFGLPRDRGGQASRPLPWGSGTGRRVRTQHGSAATPASRGLAEGRQPQRA